MKLRTLFLTLLFVLASAASAEDIVVHGTVVGAADSEPLIGATVVSVSSPSVGASTDFNGAFTIKVPAGTRLRITYVGFTTQTVDALPQLTVKMAEDSKVMDEVVVVGYATQRKADLTGAVSVVSMADMRKQNENNPMKALQGRVPGMNITGDGNPSGSATVRIRGIGTLNNNDPLYIIDGVPTKGGMHELNGNDIESIQVLKDAASASIYGSRAANGVIIITTKNGKAGETKVNFEASLAATNIGKRLKVLNTEGYGRALWQAYVNEGQDPNTNALGYRFDWGYDAAGYPQLNSLGLNKYLDAANTVPAADTDWIDQTTRTGFVQQYNLSVSRGTDKGNSFFSVGYYKNLGVIKHSDFGRLSARVNTSYKLLGDVVTIGENMTFNRTSEVAAPGDFLENALQFNPSIPVRDTHGEWAGPVGGYPGRENPLARLTRSSDNRYTFWRAFGDMYININPLKGLNIKTTFGLDYSQKQQRFFTYPITEGTMANSTNAVEAKQEHWTRWMWNLVGTYNLTLGQHRIDLLAGMELNREDDTNISAYKEDFIILRPDYMWPSAGSGEAMAYGGGEGFSLVSFFGKVNYAWHDRYLLSATVRRDGSSRFGQNNRYATFPAFTAGWRISDEAFMAGTRSWLDDLKVRASWGQTGNQEISNYARYMIYVPNYGVNEGGGGGYGTSYDIAGTNGGSTLPSGFKRNQMANDDIKWETTTQLDFGLDFGLFANKLYGSFDWYHKNTDNILVEMAGIAAMGEGSSQWINAGEMQNNGFELNLGLRNTTSYGLTYDISANISAYRNKITRLPSTVAANGTFGGNGVKSVIGHANGSQVGYVADGIFRNQDEVDNHAKQEGATPGRIRWRDLDGNGVIDESDQQWIYDPTPDFSYGLNIYLQYKGFDLSMFWQGVQGADIISDLKKETDLWSGLNIGFLNKGERLLNAWTPQNPDATIPALSRSDVNNEKRVSTYFVEDGSYLKLRNVQLGYNLPERLTHSLSLDRVRFYISASNLLTIHAKSFTGVDPENPNFGYPIPQTYTFGINVGF